MNIVIATLYGFTFWLSCLAYAVITHGRWGVVALAMPLFVSGAASALLVIDLATHLALKAIRKRRRTHQPAE